MRSYLWALLLGAFVLIVAMVPVNAQENGNNTVKFITDIEADEALIPPSSALAPIDLLLEIGQGIESTELDCSHFVQWLYEQAGLYYGYAPSRTLYQGMPGFRRVFHPRRGDLVVWPGHVGIVVDPQEETFLSSLRSGVKTSSYTSRYWKRRGRTRFFRYVGTQSPPAIRRQVASYQHPGRVAGAE